MDILKGDAKILATKKEIRGVIVPRHDTAINWSKAVNFTPENGELIIISADNATDVARGYYLDSEGNKLTSITVNSNGVNKVCAIKPSDKVRFKFGNGKDNVNALPFQTEAIQGTASGSVIQIDDISPVTHEIGVKVRGKNLFDEKQITGCIGGDSEVEYSRYGEVIDGCLVSKLATYDRGTMWNGFKIYLEKNETYTLSADAYFGTNKEGTKRVTVGFIMKNSDGTLKDFTNLVMLSTWDKWEHITTQLNVTESGYYYLRLQATGGDAQYKDMDARFKNIQVEIGTNATAYTPYVDLSAVKVYRYGKNFIDIDNIANEIVNANPENCEKTQFDGKRCLKIGSTANMDFTVPNGVKLYGLQLKVYNNNYDGSFMSVTKYDTEATPNYIKAETSNEWETIEIYYSDISEYFTGIQFYKEDSEKPIYIDLDSVMLEAGHTSTEYEPYNCMSVTADLNGNVEGMISIFPKMTLLTENSDVIINCTYNVDTKTYIDNKIAELMQ